MSIASAQRRTPISKLAAFVERSRVRMRRGLDEVAGGGGGPTSLPPAFHAGSSL
jgi:hypothetical protein